MDKNLYQIMQEILKAKGTENTKDIRYMGTITSKEKDTVGDVETTADIFMLIDEMPDGSEIKKFYNENMDFVGGSAKDGKIYPSDEMSQNDLSFLGQLEDISQTNGISLDEMDNMLEQVARELGIHKKDIIAMSESDLRQKVESRDEAQLELSEDERGNTAEQAERNDEALNKINSKQEIDLSQKVDDRHTLGEVLGVDPSSKLIAVYSDTIADNKNTTRFSFIIRNADGSLEPANMLTQVGGKDSDKNNFEVNRDGSKVEKQAVNSSYAIDSPIVKNGILTARIGSMGYIELGYGQMDRTSHRDTLTQSLETERTRYTTYEVREEFSNKQGEYNIENDIDELKKHEEYGCNDMSLDEADGDVRTGHVHERAVEEIKSYDSTIADVFTDSEIEERLQSLSEKYPEDKFEDTVEKAKKELSEDASRIHTR